MDRSDGLMGEWTVDQYIVGTMSFQKMYGLYGLREHPIDSIFFHWLRGYTYIQESIPRVITNVLSLSSDRDCLNLAGTLTRPLVSSE